MEILGNGPKTPEKARKRVSSTPQDVLMSPTSSDASFTPSQDEMKDDEEDQENRTPPRVKRGENLDKN
jgi:hypothetical protein